MVALRVPGGGEMSRSEIDAYTEFVKIYGAKGLAWIKVNDASKGREGLQSPIVKNLHDAAIAEIIARSGARNGDLLFFGADKAKVVNDAIGALRVKVGHSEFGRKNGLFEDKWAPLWVVDFPMFEHDEENDRWAAVHHPFTAPKDGHEDLMDTDPGACIAKAYDMVLNGWELGGGSVRIHRAEVQSKVFRALKIGPEEAQEKFGFLLDALQYGAPPHGGLAFGLDRIVTMMAKAESIRDVIAFPKTQRAQCLLTARAQRGGREAVARAAHPAAQPAGRAVLRMRLVRRTRARAVPLGPSHASSAVTTPRPPKIPESVLVVIHTAELEVLLLERADQPGFWQSVTGSKDAAGESLVETCIREVEEETGIVIGSSAVPLSALRDWQLANVYEIYPVWRHRYAPGVTHNTEHVFGLTVPRGTRGDARPSRAPAHVWLPWREAADRCFSPSNAEAVLQLPRFAADPPTQRGADASAAAVLDPAARRRRRPASRGHLQHPQGSTWHGPGQAAGDPQPRCRDRGLRRGPGLPAGGPAASTGATRDASPAPRSAGPAKGRPSSWRPTATTSPTAPTRSRAMASTAMRCSRAGRSATPGSTTCPTTASSSAGCCMCRCTGRDGSCMRWCCTSA